MRLSVCLLWYVCLLPWVIIETVVLTYNIYSITARILALCDVFIQIHSKKKDVFGLGIRSNSDTVKVFERKKKTSSVYDCTVEDVEYICNSNSTLCLFFFFLQLT